MDLRWLDKFLHWRLMESTKMFSSASRSRNENVIHQFESIDRTLSNHLVFYLEYEAVGRRT